MKLFQVKINENDEDERERERQRQPQAQPQAQTRTQTRTRTAHAAPDMSAFQRDMDSHERGTQNVPQKKRWGDLPALRQASAVQTRQATANVGLPAEAGEKLTFLQSLGLQDELSDAEAAQIAGAQDVTTGERPVPREPGTDVANIETMPDVINKEVANFTPIEPEWHQIKNLPGYLKAAIRAMGRQVFGTFTKTRIENMQVIANLNGQGPNTERELNAVAGWLKDKGERDTDGEMNFQRSIPDYDANFQMYSAKDFTFMIVQDDYGNYVYSWPSKDNKY